MGKGGGTHTHILLLATAEEAGGTSGWSGVHRSLLLLFRFLLLFNAADLFLSGERERERERGRRVTPQQPACVAHTTQRERDGSRVCPILLLLLAFGGGGERRDIGWLGLCGSIGWFLVLLCSRRREHAPFLPWRQAEAHITPRTSNNARS